MGKHAKKETNHKMKPTEYPVPLDQVLPKSKSRLEQDIEIIDGRTYADKPEGYRLSE